MGEDSTKVVIFIASSQEDLRAFPESVKGVMGFALFQAERGGKHPRRDSDDWVQGSRRT
jgi:phage-related protein